MKKSKCCNAVLINKLSYGTGHIAFQLCGKCNQPCEIIEEENMGKLTEKIKSLTQNNDSQKQTFDALLKKYESLQKKADELARCANNLLEECGPAGYSLLRNGSDVQILEMKEALQTYKKK